MTIQRQAYHYFIPLILGSCIIIVAILLLVQNTMSIYSSLMFMIGGLLFFSNGIWSMHTVAVHMDEFELKFYHNIIKRDSFLLADIRKVEFNGKKKLKVVSKGIEKIVFLDSISKTDRIRVFEKLEQIIQS